MEILYFRRKLVITCLSFTIDDAGMEEVRTFPKATASLTGVWHTVPDNQRPPKFAGVGFGARQRPSNVPRQPPAPMATPFRANSTSSDHAAGSIVGH